jgi:hypothetical protein
VELTLGNGPGAQKHPVGQCAFTMVDVSNDTEVAYMILIHPEDCNKRFFSDNYNEETIQMEKTTNSRFTYLGTKKPDVRL